MKRISLLITAVLGFAAISCNRANPEKPIVNPVPEVFTAALNNGEDKVYMDTDKDFLWTSGDEISVFGSATNLKYRFNGSTGSNTGTFSKVSGESSTTYSKYYAVYPYNASTSSCAEGSFNCTIPEIQSYVKDSFDPKAALMIATTQDISSTDLKFKHVGAYLGVKIYSKTNLTARKVILTGNNHECLFGTGTVTVNSEGIPSFELVAGEDHIGGSGENLGVESGSEWNTKTIIGGGSEGIGSGDAKNNGRRIVIDCTESGVKVGATKECATLFTFAIPAREFSKGFTVTIQDITGGIHSKSTAKSINLSRASVKTMSPFEMDMAGGGLELTSFCLISPVKTKYSAPNIGNSTIDILIPASVDKSSLTAEFTTTGSEVYVGATKQESGVSVNDFSSGCVVYTVKNIFGESKNYTVNILPAPKLIACWGDSFTHYGNDVTCYPPRLQEQLGATWTVYDGGISGDRSNEIAARQGAIKTIIRKDGGFTFPEGTTNVSITTVCTDDKTLDPETSYVFRPGRWTYPTRGLNNCIVGGVECKLANNQVQRAAAGSEVYVADKSPITTYGAAHCKDADVIVIYIGTNGGWQHYNSNYDLLIAQHQAMIDFTTQKKYIVLASHISHGFTFHGGDNPTYLQKMKDAFGNHVIYLRSEVNSRAEELLVRTGVYKNASEISAADRQYIEKGDWPLSFFCSASNEHPSRYGSTAMAILIKEKMIELGYLDN